MGRVESIEIARKGFEVEQKERKERKAILADDRPVRERHASKSFEEARLTTMSIYTSRLVLICTCTEQQVMGAPIAGT